MTSGVEGSSCILTKNALCQAKMGEVKQPKCPLPVSRTTGHQRAGGKQRGSQEAWRAGTSPSVTYHSPKPHSVPWTRKCGNSGVVFPVLSALLYACLPVCTHRLILRVSSPAGSQPEPLALAPCNTVPPALSFVGRVKVPKRRAPHHPEPSCGRGWHLWIQAYLLTNRDLGWACVTQGPHGDQRRQEAREEEWSRLSCQTSEHGELRRGTGSRETERDPSASLAFDMTKGLGTMQ